MYAQEVLRDLEKHLKKVEDADFKKMAPNVHRQWQIHMRSVRKDINQLKTSHKFHMGKVSKLFDVMSVQAAKDTLLEDDKEFQFLKLPYPVSYFDIENDTKDKLSRSVIIIREFPYPDNDFWAIQTFLHATFQCWIPSPISIIAHPRGEVSQLEYQEVLKRHKSNLDEIIIADNAFYGYSNASPDQKYNFMFMITGLSPITGTDEDDNFYMTVGEIQFDIMKYIHLFLKLLSCTNVGTNPIEVFASSKKVGRGGFGGRKLPLPMFTYHTLKLKLPKRKNEEEKDMNVEEAMRHYRKHFCRGHFKTYTEEKPLLNRFVGRFWFSAHLRGTEPGFVDKDYKAVINE